MTESPLPIRSAHQWQEAWKSADARLTPFHRTVAWEWKPVASARLDRPAPGISATAAAEWKAWLAPYVEDQSLLSPIDELTGQGALAVVTGQQAGVALGPLYALYKALGAKHWAARIAADTGKPCVPVFWVASDDHDLREIEEATWLGTDGRKQALRFINPPNVYTQSAFRTPLPADSVKVLLERLEETTTNSEFRPGILEALNRSFQAGERTYESHFVSLLCQWLLPLGILPLVPRLGFVREAARPLIAREIALFAETNQIVKDAGERIRAIGLDPPLHRGGDELNFFVEVNGVRGKVTHVADRFEVREPSEGKQLLATHSSAELLQLVEKEPGRFSPNAILRPLVQDAALPTVAYIAGPTELVYHGQIGGLYDGFQVTRPAVFPRPNVALLEGRVEKAAKKLGLPVTALATQDRAALEAAIIAAASGGEASSGFAAKVATLEHALRELEKHLQGMTQDTGVVKALERLSSSVATGTEKLKERVAFVLSTADADKAAARERVLEALFPGGDLQERSIGLLSPLLMQNGAVVIERLYNAIDYTAPGMQAIPMATLR